MTTVSIGSRFGRLTVQAPRPSRSHSAWLCVCDCGTLTVARDDHLRNARTRSCGCLRHEMAVDRQKTHGLSTSSEYRVWASMRARCSNPNVNRYADYGGRGIRVCQRWESFENFWADMGPRPEGLTLDRKDSNGTYSPDNCRWATTKEQARNMRTNKLVPFNGSTRCIAEWAELTGIQSRTIQWRLSHGWSPERALVKGSDA